MAKRGPAPRGEYADKSAVLSTKISSELRSQLEKAVKVSGLTLSREVEHRLRRTFQDEATNVEMFGGQRNYRLMQLVGLAMTLRDPDESNPDWLNDPSQFLDVLRTIHRLLWQIRPEGTDAIVAAGGPDCSVRVAEELWAAVHSADATLPLGVSPQQHRRNLVKDDLGEIVSRLTFSYIKYPPAPPKTEPEHTHSRRKRK